MKNSRKTAIAIMVLAAVLAFGLYGTEYSTSAQSQNLSATLSEYIFHDDVEAEVIETKKIGNHLLVLFTDQRYKNFMGLAVFKQGLNLRWRPMSANYGNSITIEAFPLAIGKQDYVAICGVNCDPGVAVYEYITTDPNPEILYANRVSGSNFIDIYESKPGYWPKLRLLDADGKDISTALRKLHTTGQTGPSAAVGTAEEFMINIFCLLIILLGFAIARFCWTLEPQNIFTEESVEK